MTLIVVPVTPWYVEPPLLPPPHLATQGGAKKSIDASNWRPPLQWVVSPAGSPPATAAEPPPDVPPAPRAAPPPVTTAWSSVVRRAPLPLLPGAGYPWVTIARRAERSAQVTKADEAAASTRPMPAASSQSDHDARLGGAPPSDGRASPGRRGPS